MKHFLATYQFLEGRKWLCLALWRCTIVCGHDDEAGCCSWQDTWHFNVYDKLLLNLFEFRLPASVLSAVLGVLVRQRCCSPILSRDIAVRDLRDANDGDKKLFGTRSPRLAKSHTFKQPRKSASSGKGIVSAGGR